mmetsp:Transcript_10313/g.24584  ORF Transcript_10313/g.24584 Transcript_10313/m.24584 type:complete len:492 (+) Transcript_10313:311-1786(+)
MCNENETTQLIPLVDDGGGESKRAGSGKPMNRQTSYDSIASFSEALSESMQRIGVLGSVAIAVNSLTGPAMLTLPATYQRSGLIPTTAAIVFICILSAFCCLHMSNTISKVQHNHDFSLDIGYSECFRRLWGPKSYNFTQVLFFLCVTFLNVSSIVDTAEVVDTFFGHWVSTGTMAINFQWIDNQLSVRLTNWDYSNCSEESLIAGECVPYHGATGILLTSGYVVTLLTFLPMALMDLKENAVMQVVGFLVLLVTSCGFIVLFLSEGLKTGNLSLWGTEWGSLFGVILFNFALVIAIPAWLYEKEPHVNVPVVIHSSSLLTSILYISIGVLGAITVPHASQNMLESLMSGVFGTAIQLCSSLFAFFIIGLGCPLFSVLARMNLTDGNALMSRNVANGLAVYMPFFFSWIFYNGDAIIKLLSWGGIIFTSLLAFVLPLLLSLHSLERGDVDGSVNVYKPWSVTSKRTQKKMLLALLGLAIASIFAAILGNIT